jgi:membrane-bound serine protease (ClpP class)
VGAICLLLAFYALGVLPVNYTGLIFIGLSFVLFFVDIKAPTHGVLTAGGIASLVAGALLLFNSPLYRVSISVVVSVALVTGLFFAFAVAKVVQASRRPPTTGRQGLVNQVARTRTRLAPKGTVMIKGELWDAEVVEGPIERDRAVRIVAVDGFCLRVEEDSE